MSRNFFVVFFMLSFLFFFSCSNATQSGATTDDDTIVAEEDVMQDESVDEVVDEMVDETTDEDAAAPPEGYTIAFTIGGMSLMGSPVTLATGYVMAVAREDLIPNDEETITGECVFLEGPPKAVKTCDSDADCPEDQRCRPRTDSRGNPIPDSDRCITLNRESLDVGPITISGFTSGTETFLFEPNDKVYKLNGQGDGKVDGSLMAYDTDYVVAGPETPTVEGLGQFGATGHLSTQLNLTEPAPVSGGMMPSIPIDPAQDLILKWTKSDPKLLVSINLTGETGYIACRVADTGEVTVSKDLLSQMTFATGMMAVQNTLEMIRHTKIPFTGEGVKAGTLDMEQRLLISMTPPE